MPSSRSAGWPVNWCRRADIEAAWLAVAGIVRSRLLLIPSKTAARVVALKTPGEAQALLRKELNAALTAIAATPAI